MGQWQRTLWTRGRAGERSYWGVGGGRGRKEAIRPLVPVLLGATPRMPTLSILPFPQKGPSAHFHLGWRVVSQPEKPPQHTHSAAYMVFSRPRWYFGVYGLAWAFRRKLSTLRPPCNPPPQHRDGPPPKGGGHKMTVPPPGGAGEIAPPNRNTPKLQPCMHNTGGVNRVET